MADLVVGRSEGVSYPNNNLTYRQFKQGDSTLKDKIDMTVRGNIDNKRIMDLCGTNFINEMVSRIKSAEDDSEIKEVLFDIYISTQMDSQVRKEFDKYYNSKYQFNQTV